MGHFSNGSEGDFYREHYCYHCINWKKDMKDYPAGCPIWDTHLLYCYGAKGKIRKILDFLIPYKDCQNGECRMFIKRTKR